jgi:hypothetical protein
VCVFLALSRSGRSPIAWPHPPVSKVRQKVSQTGFCCAAPEAWFRTDVIISVVDLHRRQGHASLPLMLKAFRENSSRFAMAAFTCLLCNDANLTNRCLSLPEFVATIHNICTWDDTSLARFTVALFDPGAVGRITYVRNPRTALLVEFFFALLRFWRRGLCLSRSPVCCPCCCSINV